MKFELMARVVGKQAVVGQNKVRIEEDGEGESSLNIALAGNSKAEEGNGMELLRGGLEEWNPYLSEKTKKEIKNLFLHRNTDDKADFERKARDFAVSAIRRA